MSFKEINLEEGRPTVSEGRERLIRELTLARDEKVRAVKLIHGYGSSGTGGRLRGEVRRYLGLLKEQKRIVDFIPGRTTAFLTRLPGSCWTASRSCGRTAISTATTTALPG